MIHTNKLVFNPSQQLLGFFYYLFFLNILSKELKMDTLRDDNVTMELTKELNKLKDQGKEITPDEVKRAYNRIYGRRYRAKNREELREYQRLYRANNPEKYKEYQARYKRENKEKINAYNREYRRKNRDKIRASREKVFKDIADTFNKGGAIDE